MPIMVKQSPKDSANGPLKVPKGSVLSRAVPVEDLKEAHLKICLYGQNRVGKTTLACGFPKPLLLISFESVASGGAESVRKIPGVHYIHVVSNNSPLLKNGKASGEHITVRDYHILVQELQASPSSFRTVVGDGGTSAEEVILANIMDLPTVPDQKSWGMVSGDQYRERSELLRECLGPLLRLPIDTIVTAKEKDHNPPKEEKISEKTGKVQPDLRPMFLRGLHAGSFVAPALGGASVGWLQDRCDICRLFVEEEEVVHTTKIGKNVNKSLIKTGKYVRYLRIAYHPNIQAGIRSCDPDKVPEVIQRPTPEMLTAIIRGSYEG